MSAASLRPNRHYRDVGHETHEDAAPAMADNRTRVCAELRESRRGGRFLRRGRRPSVNRRIENIGLEYDYAE
jgi:hypothetical protein